MPKLWALKDFTSSIYKLHKITNSPSPLQKYLVKYVLYCFSLTVRLQKQGSIKWRECIWYRAESLAGRGGNKSWTWSTASKNNFLPLPCAVGKPKGSSHPLLLLSYWAIICNVHFVQFASGRDIHKHLCACWCPNLAPAARAVPGTMWACSLAKHLALKKTAVTLHSKCLALTWHQGSNPQSLLLHLR